MSSLHVAKSPCPRVASPLIIAHRGASARAPENTVAGFRKAIESGAEGVEFDVRLSSDGVPVVIHDTTLTRTAGIDKPVSAFTAEQLSEIDAGSWFNAAYPAYSRPEFAAEGVPALGSVLRLLEGIAGPIYIEAKCEIEADVSPLIDAVCDEIATSPLREKIIVGSFHLGVISQMHAVLPDVQTAALFAPKIMRLLRKEKYLINIAKELGADHLSLHKSLVSGKLARKAARYGMPVTVWTVDNARWIPRAIRQRLFAVITNDPSTMSTKRDAMLRQQTQGETRGPGTSHDGPLPAEE